MTRRGRGAGIATALLGGAALLAIAPTRADEAPAAGPDVEMLEFLGAWDAGDEDWVVMNIEDLDEAPGRQEGGDDAAGSDDDER